jgi:acyl-CoA thioester hydrolase
MPRIKLIQQHRYEHRCGITARISDTNVAGHVGFSQMVEIIHEARHRFFVALGVRELDLGDGRTSIIIGDLAVNFLGEVFAGDQVVAESLIGEIGKVGFRVYHRFIVSGRMILLAETGVVSFDSALHKMAPIPREFIAALENFRAGN